MTSKLSCESSLTQPNNTTADSMFAKSCSTSPPIIPDALHHGATNLEPTKCKVLEIIRNHFPLTTLFTPELKIDLGVFIKDQMLMQRIATFIPPLVTTSAVNSEFIAKHFENTPLQKEIRALFKQEAILYLSSLYEACSDVLNKKPFSKNLFNPAIEGRIFTLKNALVAQHFPQTILSNQVDCKIAQQATSIIKEEGAIFIRECLRFYSLEKKESPPFKADLISTAEQLIPFVRTITKIFLREHGKECTDNPLTFRNPSGYNHHGLTAATIMETCLDLLGYTTQVVVRSDLEPKVTLATAHSVVQVTAPDRSRYVVDPCYIQFHKDLSLDDSLLPQSPVLVLSETEVDTYIEENLMVHWKSNATLVKNRVMSVIQKLDQQDKSIPFRIDSLGLPPEFIPPNPEEWVRKALKRVWELRTYTPVLSNAGFQKIFAENAQASKTHDYIKGMGIASLSHHMPFAEVERRLTELLHDPKLQHQNTPEALSLIAQLPTEQKKKYTSLLDLDPRITAIGVLLNAYFRSLKKIVNPDGKDTSVIYGCAGADCITVMLATDAKDYIFVDLTPLSYKEFGEALARLKRSDPVSDNFLRIELEQSKSFISVQFGNGGASSRYCNGKHEMENLALKFFYNLRDIGVDLDKIVLTSSKQGKAIRVDFPWQYHGASSPRNRSVTFLNADITTPHTYPDLLKAQLENGIDIFYMKAGFLVPQHYPEFLPLFARSIKEGGWLMTADKTFTMENVNPEKCLEQNGSKFMLQGNKETRIMEQLLSIPFDPLCTISLLHYYPPERRHERNPGSNATYWAILSLRRKV